MLKFILFIMDQIFPGGELPFVAQSSDTQSKPVFRWPASSRFSPITPERWTYRRRLSRATESRPLRFDPKRLPALHEVPHGCADLFRDGYTDVCQFTLLKNG